MKTVLLSGALVLTSLWAHAATDSAYSALRILGKQSGAQSLNRVVEVRGRSGAPVPAVWKVILSESRAPGGIREVDIQRGQIIAERTPAGRSPGVPMNFNQLNLDSEGAFTIANQQAEKAGVPFDHIDYVLRRGEPGAAPVWDIKLLSAGAGTVASLQIAADTGTVLNQQGFAQRGAGPYPRVAPSRPEEPPMVDDGDYVRSEPRGPESRRRSAQDAHEPIRDVPSFLRRTGQHFERRGVQIKRFFVGE